jgi:hypothetical protein
MKTNKERLAELRAKQVLKKCYDKLESETKTKFIIDDVFHSQAAIDSAARWICRFMNHPSVEIFPYEDIEKELEANISLTLLYSCTSIINTEGNGYVIE